MTEQGSLERLPRWVKPGVTFRIIYSEASPNNETLHIRGLVDSMAVLRVWQPRRQRWHYRVEHPAFFHVLKDNIRQITKTRKTG